MAEISPRRGKVLADFEKANYSQMTLKPQSVTNSPNGAVNQLDALNSRVIGSYPNGEHKPEMPYSDLESIEEPLLTNVIWATNTSIRRRLFVNKRVS